MKNICFVVHRYAPFPGGSEYYVQQMAEECVRRNINVTVLAGEHKGNLNRVHVTSELRCLLNQDLIIVHGGDVAVQNFVLSNARKINSPILYLLVKPSTSDVCLQALEDVRYIGCSTFEDWDHVKKYSVQNKARKIIHGISPLDCIGEKNKFREKHNIPKNKKMFLSCGGYWPNKKMKELVDTFKKANLNDAILITTGYDNRYRIMPDADFNIIPMMIENPKDVKDAIADADCYIMNSSEEGFGLVILESMLNKTPWISRNIAGAKLLSKYGTVYETEDQLIEIIKTWKSNSEQINEAYDYVVKNHTIKNTVDDILKI